MVPWYVILIVAVIAFGCGYGFRGLIHKQLTKIGDKL